MLLYFCLFSDIVTSGKCLQNRMNQPTTTQVLHLPYLVFVTCKRIYNEAKCTADKVNPTSMLSVAFLLSLGDLQSSHSGLLLALVNF